VSGSPTVVIVVVRSDVRSGAKLRRPTASSSSSSILGDPALTIGCVKGGEAINVVTSKTPFTEPIGKSDTAEWGGWETSWRGVAGSSFSRGCPKRFPGACCPWLGGSIHPMTMPRLTAVGGIGSHPFRTVSQRYLNPDGHSVSTCGRKGALDHVASGRPGLWPSAMR
jgi:hypothetical protein